MPQATLSPTIAPPVIRDWLNHVTPLVNRKLDAILEPRADDQHLTDAMRYAVLGGGKRLRPALTLAVCDALGSDIARALPGACALELLHAYTLVHDDLPAMDDDDTRRGRPTVHKKFDEATAILAGDGLLTAAFATLCGLDSDPVAAVHILAHQAGSRALLRGQACDLAMSAKPPRTVEDLERVHRDKTGALFSAAAAIGAIAAGACETDRKKMADYGMNLGIAFQFADDRDDADFPQLATKARARAASLAHTAQTIASDTCSNPKRLVAFARWFGQL